jgi:Zn-dependent peptidase ImmA (M78 family)/transcriptional regulator with XRE-family HTH domain
MRTSFETLRELREGLFRFGFRFVAERARIQPERLARIESGDELPTLDELERLGALYGLDAEVLEEEPIRLQSGDALPCLASMNEFADIGDLGRARIIAASRAAAELRELAAADPALADHSWERFVQEAPRMNRPRQPLAPHRKGGWYAVQLRRYLNLGTRPIASMRDFVRQHFPAVAVLYADFGRDGPAGVAFADRVRGPTIILNTVGKNENPCVRRFSMAHELAHLLIDWNRQQPLVTISGYLNESALDVERCANSFAVRLLCPEAVIHGVARGESSYAKLQDFGLPYAAVKLYLRNEGGVALAAEAARVAELVGTDEHWARAEAEPGLKEFPLKETPPERRTLVAHAAARAYSRGDIPRDRFAELLGVTPGARVERVLDFFTLDPPRTDESAA